MKVTLVFGASLKSERYSNVAIKRLREHKISTLAFGLKEGMVSDVHIKKNLINFNEVDTVTLYMNPKRQESYYNDIINLKPRRVIFNPGTENPVFYNLLKKHNIEVEIACTLVLLATKQY